MNIPEGFEHCEQCQVLHLPVERVCGWKLTKDAAFVLDACGAALGAVMVGRVLRELDTSEGYRYVSAPEQRRAYLLSGRTLQRTAGGRERADDGVEWLMRADYPTDVLMVETSRGFGLIKRLAVPSDRAAEGRE
jgi:hypothetical protein